MKQLLQKLPQATRYEPLQQQLLTACALLLAKGVAEDPAPFSVAVKVCCLLLVMTVYAMCRYASAGAVCTASNREA